MEIGGWELIRVYRQIETARDLIGDIRPNTGSQEAIDILGVVLADLDRIIG